MHALPLLLIPAALFIGMLLASEVGRRKGLADIHGESGSLAKGVGVVEGAVFALLGLVVAFTFSGAGDRLEARRALITEEANDIGTAYLRLDMLEAGARSRLQDRFRSYLDTRSLPPDFGDAAAMSVWYAKTEATQQAIWNDAVSATRDPASSQQSAMLLLPALNAMIDISTTRRMAIKNHPPLAIYLLLGALGLAGAWLAGYSLAENPRRIWLHPLAFTFIMALAVYLILDLEVPRAGFINATDADQVLVELRESIH